MLSLHLREHHHSLKWDAQRSAHTLVNYLIVYTDLLDKVI